MKQKIQIAHIVGKWNGGGVEAVLMNYFKLINHNNFEFDFICDSDSKKIPYDEIKQLGGNVIIVPPYQKLFSYNKVLTSILSKKKYQIIHSHINTLSVFPLRIAKKCGVPIRIAHSHSTSNKREIFRNMLKIVLKRFSRIYATDYFACSEFSGIWLFGNKLYEKKEIYFLNNAIDIDKFRYNETKRINLRNEFDIDDDTLVIGHVGRFSKQKNHHFIIKVFYEIQKIKKNSILILVGNGPLLGNIRALVDKLSLQQKVIFLDYRDDIGDLYSMFDIFLLPSLYEGLPLVGIEAQCSGLFCVFSYEVTSEIKIFDDVKFISLSESYSKWAKVILDGYSKTNREDNYKSLENSEFNIKKEVVRLEKRYRYLLRSYNAKKSNRSCS